MSYVEGSGKSSFRYIQHKASAEHRKTISTPYFDKGAHSNHVHITFSANRFARIARRGSLISAEGQPITLAGEER